MPAKPAMHDSDVRAHMGRELKRNSQKAVEDARQRLTSSSGTRSAFDFELIDEYANSRLSSVLAVPALVLILAVFASLWVSPFAAAGWAALVIAHQLGRRPALPALQARRPGQVQRRPLDHHLRRRRDACYGVAWALLTVFSFIGDDTAALQVAMFAMGLVGIASNAVTTRTLPRRR